MRLAKNQINPLLGAKLVQKIHRKTDCRLISLLVPGPGSGGLCATFGVVGKTGSQECDSEQGQGRGRVMIEQGFVHPEY